MLHTFPCLIFSLPSEAHDSSSRGERSSGSAHSQPGNSSPPTWSSSTTGSVSISANGTGSSSIGSTQNTRRAGRKGRPDRTDSVSANSHPVEQGGQQQGTPSLPLGMGVGSGLAGSGSVRKLSSRDNVEQADNSGGKSSRDSVVRVQTSRNWFRGMFRRLRPRTDDPSAS